MSTASYHDLSVKHCEACEGGVEPLDRETLSDQIQQLPGWQIGENEIFKAFSFKDHYQTIAFVNAVAWISHREGHHPDLEVGYNQCTVHYSTHAAGGVTGNDLICAAKIESLLAL